MTKDPRRLFEKVFEQLQITGLLLVSDSAFPNIRSLVTGKPGRGSWWSDESAQEIFTLAEMLEDHADVMMMKLVSGKVTFVHRDLWRHIYSIAVAREPWQMEKLSAGAKLLLKSVESEGSFRTSQLPPALRQKPKEVVEELESRMLIRSSQIHTESGAHAKVLETWQRWAKRIDYKVRSGSPVKARRLMDQKLDSINTMTKSDGRLPWQRKS